MNELYWKETKYSVENGHLAASKDNNYLGEASYLMASITAHYYDKYIPKYAHGVLADLGCGNAPMYMFYKKYVERVICADWERSLHKNKFIDIKCDLSQKLPLENKSVDTIILSDVLEHVYNPDNLFCEMYRILKKGGVVLLNTPFAYLEHEIPFDFNRFTYFYYKEKAIEYGFSALLIEKVGGEKEVLADMIGKYMNRRFIYKKIHLAKYINILAYKRWKKERKKCGSDISLGYFAVLKKCHD